jgi:hypothetical protein
MLVNEVKIQDIVRIQKIVNVVLFCFVFVVLGLELRAYTLSHSTSPIFVKIFSRLDLEELFARAGFKPRSS